MKLKPQFLNLDAAFRNSLRRVGTMWKKITGKKSPVPANESEKLGTKKVYPRPRRYGPGFHRQRPKLPLYGELRKLAKGNDGFTLAVPRKKKKDKKTVLA